MAEGRMNLAALQQRDPYISEIVDTASQVALYSFNSTTVSWEKTSIEGSLFIYTRSAHPVNGFMILNRLGLNNLIEPLSKDHEFDQKDPFLLYRNSKNIYGIWFYDKDECKRIGEKLKSYLDKLSKDPTKGPSPRLSPGGATARSADDSKGMAGIMPTSQVDIMQMLSKAQKEYDTGSKKSEPKPMIDNPNASATKTSSLIRPRPLKMPDSDTTTTQGEESVTPGTGIITLDQLFRTASLQQGNQPGSSQPQPQMDSYFSDPRAMQRSISLAAGTSSQKTTAAGGTGGSGEVGASEGEDMPPLLKHIMSTGSMVEDIERQQQSRGQTTGDTGLRDDKGQGSRSLTTGVKSGGDGAGVGAVGTALPSGLPDLTQPPPNHPAYRGVSPHQPPPMPPLGARKSPHDNMPGASGTDPTVRLKKPLEKKEKRKSDPESSKSKLEPIGIPGPGIPPPQILSGNLIPTFGSSSSQVTPVFSSNLPPFSQLPKVSPELSAATRTSPRPETEATAKMEPLLTPGALISSISSASTTNTSFSQDKPNTVVSSLASAAASLGTELLSPMAFVTSVARKTPPVTQSQERPSSVYSDRGDQSQDSSQEALSVAALTREQLAQALIHLLKNDGNFISTIHEAYLKSLQELSGHKS